MRVDLKGHFASHFGTHKAHMESMGGEFNLGDIDFKEMEVDLKGHFASHFGTHKAHMESMGGEFNLGDIDFKEMFRSTFTTMTGGSGEEVVGGQRCKTVSHHDVSLFGQSKT